MKKAQVFISCGQRTIEEKKVGKSIYKYFKDRNFEPYFAEEVHTPESLTTNIYNSLKNSEYFVCVLSPREGMNIGSLFIQQELAIASFLEIPMAVFYFGSIELDGVTKYLIINPFKVKDSSELMEKLSHVSEKWDNKSVNQLSLSFDHHSPNMRMPEISGNMRRIVMSDWYHIVVDNLSKRYHAKNCVGYIREIKEVNSRKHLLMENDYKTELVWAGIGSPFVSIPISSKRDLDAFYIKQNENKILFHQINTSTSYGYKPLIYGMYSITYSVLSETLPEASLEVKLKFETGGLQVVGTKQL